jgi:hypothetical protein
MSVPEGLCLHLSETHTSWLQRPLTEIGGQIGRLTSGMNFQLKYRRKAELAAPFRLAWLGIVAFQSANARSQMHIRTRKPDTRSVVDGSAGINRRLLCERIKFGVAAEHHPAKLIEKSAELSHGHFMN